MNEVEPNEVQLLVIRLKDQGEGSLDVCIDCRQVLEVLEDQIISAVPKGVAPFVGLLKLREQPVPVLDFASLMDSAIDTSRPERFVVCQVSAGKVALRVSGSLMIRLTPSAAIRSVPPSLAERAQAIACPQIVQMNHGHRLIVDVDRLLTKLLEESRKVA